MIWVTLVIVAVRQVTRLQLTVLVSLILTAVCAVVLVLVLVLHLGQPLQSLAVLYTAALLGCVVSAIFREPNVLLPVALLAPIIDYWTVKFGPVSHAIVSPRDILPVVSVTIPGAHALKPLALMGAGDFLFMAMFLAAAERLKMQPDRTVWLFIPLVAITMILVLWVDAIGRTGMPGLVVISLGFLIANWRCFRLTRGEIVITSVIVGMAFLVVGYIQFQASFR